MDSLFLRDHLSCLLRTSSVPDNSACFLLLYSSSLSCVIGVSPSSERPCPSLPIRFYDLFQCNFYATRMLRFHERQHPLHLAILPATILWVIVPNRSYCTRYLFFGCCGLAATVCVLLFDSGGRLMLDGLAGLALPLYLIGQHYIVCFLICCQCR